MLISKLKSKYIDNYFELNTIFGFSISAFIIYFYLNDGWMTHVDSIDYISGIDSYLNGGEWVDDSLAFRPGALIFSIPWTLFFDNIAAFVSEIKRSLIFTSLDNKKFL